MITVDHPVVNTGYKVMKNQPISLIVKADGTAEATVYYEVDKNKNSIMKSTTIFMVELTLFQELHRIHLKERDILEKKLILFIQMLVLMDIG